MLAVFSLDWFVLMCCCSTESIVFSGISVYLREATLFTGIRWCSGMSYNSHLAHDMTLHRQLHYQTIQATPTSLLIPPIVLRIDLGRVPVSTLVVRIVTGGGGAVSALCWATVGTADGR